MHASAEENPELFWAIRGGGGNFGIVTAFDFAAHPTTYVFHGKIAFAASEAATVMQRWADYLRTAPEELTSTADFANPFGGGPEEVRTSERSPFIAVRSVGGAVSRVPDDATAYAHRHAELMFVTTSAGPKPVVEAARPALEAIWERLAPHVNGAYANFLSSVTEEDVAAVYPTEVYDRLTTVKRQYDPGNLFARNHNVRPH